MKKPSELDMFFGQTGFATVASVLTLASIYRSFSDGALWWGTIAMVIVMIPIVKANTARVDFLKWKSAWDSVAQEPRSPSRPFLRPRPWLGAVMLFALGLALFLNADDPTYAVAFVWWLLTVLVAGGVAVILRLRRRGGRALAKGVVVSVCIRRPVMPVTALTHAYRALPDYCRPLLGRSS